MAAAEYACLRAMVRAEDLLRLRVPADLLGVRVRVLGVGLGLGLGLVSRRGITADLLARGEHALEGQRAHGVLELGVPG